MKRKPNAFLSIDAGAFPRTIRRKDAAALLLFWRARGKVQRCYRPNLGFVAYLAGQSPASAALGPMLFRTLSLPPN